MSQRLKLCYAHAPAPPKEQKYHALQTCTSEKEEAAPLVIVFHVTTRNKYIELNSCTEFGILEEMYLHAHIQLESLVLGGHGSTLLLGWRGRAGHQGIGASGHDGGLASRLSHKGRVLCVDFQLDNQILVLKNSDSSE